MEGKTISRIFAPKLLFFSVVSLNQFITVTPLPGATRKSVQTRADGVLNSAIQALSPKTPTASQELKKKVELAQQLEQFGSEKQLLARCSSLLDELLSQVNEGGWIFDRLGAFLDNDMHIPASHIAEAFMAEWENPSSFSVRPRSETAKGAHLFAWDSSAESWPEIADLYSRLEITDHPERLSANFVVEVLLRDPVTSLREFVLAANSAAHRGGNSVTSTVALSQLYDDLSSLKRFSADAPSVDAATEACTRLYSQKNAWWLRAVALNMRYHLSLKYDREPFTREQIADLDHETIPLVRDVSKRLTERLIALKKRDSTMPAENH